MKLSDLLTHIPTDQIAQQLGVSDEVADRVARAAVPALVQNMQANARSADGAAALTQALQQHSHRLTASGMDLDHVDVADGTKIVRHVLGDSTDQAVRRIGGGGIDNELVRAVLPILAPMVMGWLGGKFGSRPEAGSAGSGVGAAGAGSDVAGSEAGSGVGAAEASGLSGWLGSLLS